MRTISSTVKSNVCCNNSYSDVSVTLLTVRLSQLGATMTPASKNLRTGWSSNVHALVCTLDVMHTSMAMRLSTTYCIRSASLMSDTPCPMRCAPQNRIESLMYSG